MDRKDHSIPLVPALLGFGGVLPFLGLALDYAWGGFLFPGFALQAFLVYSAVILGYVGGVRWGTAIGLRPAEGVDLAWSSLPPLWAVGCLLLPSPQYTVWGLLIGHVVSGVLDLMSPSPGAPGWFSRLRLQLIIAVAICHGILLAGL